MSSWANIKWAIKYSDRFFFFLWHSHSKGTAVFRYFSDHPCEQQRHHHPLPKLWAVAFCSFQTNHHFFYPWLQSLCCRFKLDFCQILPYPLVIFLNHRARTNSITLSCLTWQAIKSDYYSNKLIWLYIYSTEQSYVKIISAHTLAKIWGCFPELCAQLVSTQ